MSLFGLFDIGKTALFASQTALTVTSNNIANVNTPGYSRQDVILSIANPVSSSFGSIGRGVSATAIVRSYDQFIQSQLVSQEQSKGKSTAMDNTWGQVEQVFNEAQNQGLASPLSELLNAWNDVASSPDTQTPRTVLIQKANNFINAAKGMERSVISTVNNTDAGITDGVTRVNTLASDIFDLNRKIVQVEAGSTTEKANDLRDQRDAKLNELADYVDFSTYENRNGSMTVVVGMRNLVTEESANKLTITLNNDGNKDVNLDGMNITSVIQKGQIGGFIAARNDIQTNVLTGLRKLVASVIQEVNTLHRSGWDLDKNAGSDFFTPLQATTRNNSTGANILATITNPNLPLNEYTISFDTAGNYSVTDKQSGLPLVPPVTGPYVSGNSITLPGIDVWITGPVNAADSFIVSPLISAVNGSSVAVTNPRAIAASSVQNEVPGNNSNALLLAKLPDTAVGNLSNATFSDYYSGLVSTIGVMSRAASDGLSFDKNLLSEITKRREALSGVSLDEEAMKLVTYQRAYQASARLITTADELIQTVLSLGTGL